MRFITRAAAFAHTFVSLNYEQAAAIKYVVRPASPSQGTVSLAPQTASSRGQGGSMAKLVWFGVATMSVVAVTGAPGNADAAPALFSVAREVATALWLVPVPAFQTPFVRLTQWSEPGSLLLLATGFFAAAVLLNRRAP